MHGKEIKLCIVLDGKEKAWKKLGLMKKPQWSEWKLILGTSDQLKWLVLFRHNQWGEILPELINLFIDFLVSLENVLSSFFF